MFEWACTALFDVPEALCRKPVPRMVPWMLSNMQSLVKGLSSSGQVLGTPCERGILCEPWQWCKRDKWWETSQEGKWRCGRAGKMVSKVEGSPQKSWKRGEQTASQQREELSDTADVCKAGSCTFCRETWCLHPPNSPATLPPLLPCRVGGFLKRLSLIYSKVTH